MSTTPSARRPRSSRNAKKGTTAGEAKTPPADTQTPLAKSSAAAADKAAKAVKEALAEVPAGDQPSKLTPKDEKGNYDAGTVRSPAAKASAPDPVDVPGLFRKGRNIAAIARDHKMGHEAIRKALDDAGVDYSADKNAKPASATRAAATPKPKGEWSLMASFESIRDKKVDPKSKRGRIVADLASESNAYALRTIAGDIVAAKADPARMAALANALNAALSAHYARVS